MGKSANPELGRVQQEHTLSGPSGKRTMHRLEGLLLNKKT